MAMGCGGGSCQPKSVWRPRMNALARLNIHTVVLIIAGLAQSYGILQ